jgi:hypothetical protein
MGRLQAIPIRFNVAMYLEKLFRRGGGLSKGAMVALGNGFREDEMVFAMHIDMLETQTYHRTRKQKR